MTEWEYTPRLGANSPALDTLKDSLSVASEALDTAAGAVDTAAGFVDLVLRYQQLLTLADPASIAIAAVDEAVGQVLRELLADGAYVLTHSNLAEAVRRNGVGAYLTDGEGSAVNPPIPSAWRDPDQYYTAVGLNALAEARRAFTIARPPGGFSDWLAEVTQAFYDRGDTNRPRSLPGSRIITLQNLSETGGEPGDPALGRFGCLALTVSGHDPVQVYQSFALVMQLFWSAVGTMRDLPLDLRSGGPDFRGLLNDWRSRILGAASLRQIPEETMPSVSPDFVRLSTADLVPSVGRFSLSIENLFRNLFPTFPLVSGLQDFVDTLREKAEDLIRIPAEAINVLEAFLTLLESLGGEKLWIDLGEGGVDRLVTELGESAASRKDVQVVGHAAGSPYSVGEYISWAQSETLRATYPGFQCSPSDRLVVIGTLIVLQEGPLYWLFKELFGQAPRTSAEVAADSEARAPVVFPKEGRSTTRFAAAPPKRAPSFGGPEAGSYSSDPADTFAAPPFDTSPLPGAGTILTRAYPSSSAGSRCLYLASDRSFSYREGSSPEDSSTGAVVGPPSSPATGALTLLGGSRPYGAHGSRLPISEGASGAGASDASSWIPASSSVWSFNLTTHQAVVLDGWAIDGSYFLCAALDAWLVALGLSASFGSLDDVLPGYTLVLHVDTIWLGGPLGGSRPCTISLKVTSVTASPARQYTVSPRFPQFPLVTEGGGLNAWVNCFQGGYPEAEWVTSGANDLGVTFESVLSLRNTERLVSETASALQASAWGTCVDADRVTWPVSEVYPVPEGFGVAGDTVAFPVAAGLPSLPITDNVIGGDREHTYWLEQSASSVVVFAAGSGFDDAVTAPTADDRGRFLRDGYRVLTVRVGPRAYIGLGRITSTPVPVGAPALEWESVWIQEVSGDWVRRPAAASTDPSSWDAGEVVPSAAVLSAYANRPWALQVRCSSAGADVAAHVTPLLASLPRLVRTGFDGMSCAGQEIVARSGMLPAGQATFGSLPRTQGTWWEAGVPNLVDVRFFEENLQGREVEIALTPLVDLAALPEGEYSLVLTRNLEITLRVQSGELFLAVWDLTQTPHVLLGITDACPSPAPGQETSLTWSWLAQTMLLSWTQAATPLATLTLSTGLLVDGLPYVGATLRIGRRPPETESARYVAEDRQTGATTESLRCWFGAPPLLIESVQARVITT